MVFDAPVQTVVSNEQESVREHQVTLYNNQYAKQARGGQRQVLRTVSVPASSTVAVNVICYMPGLGFGAGLQLVLETSGGDAPLANGTYTLTPECAPLQRLDVPSAATGPGARVHTYTDNGHNAQKWYLNRQADGSYRISSVLNSSLVLDVVGAGTGARTDVQTWTWSGHPAQRWDLVPAGNGTYQLRPRCAPNLALDVEGGNSDPGGNLWLYDASNASAQQWRFTATTAN